MAASISVDAEAVGTIEPCEWLRLRVTRVACFTALIDNFALLPGKGRISDPPLLVEDADPFNSRLGGHGIDRAVKPLPIVPQHVFCGSLLDYVADAFGRGQRVLLQM